MLDGEIKIAKDMIVIQRLFLFEKTYLALTANRKRYIRIR